MIPPYSRCLQLEWTDADGWMYTAWHPELLGCRGQGTTPAEAIADLDEARTLYLESLERDDLPFPPADVLHLAT